MSALSKQLVFTLFSTLLVSLITTYRNKHIDIAYSNARRTILDFDSG